MSAAPASAEGKSKPGMMTAEQAAALLEVTPQWIGRLHKQGYIPREGKGQYPLVGVVRGYVRYLKDEERRSSKSAADSRVRDARAKEIELRTAQRAATLIETDVALAMVDEVVGAVRTGFGSLAAQLSRDGQERRRIQAKVDEILGTVATVLAKRAQAVKAGGDFADADAEDEP